MKDQSSSVTYQKISKFLLKILKNYEVQCNHYLIIFMPLKPNSVLKNILNSFKFDIIYYVLL